MVTYKYSFKSQPNPKEEKPESAFRSLYIIVLILASLIALAFSTMRFHSCGTDWLFAVIKSSGTHCLATMIVAAIAAPFAYWAFTSKTRDAAAGIVRQTYVSQRIATYLMPSNIVGGTLAIATMLALVVFFTRECQPTE